MTAMENVKVLFGTKRQKRLSLQDHKILSLPFLSFFESKTHHIVLVTLRTMPFTRGLKRKKEKILWNIIWLLFTL